MEYQAFSSTAQRVLIAVAVCCLLAAAGQSSIADDTAVGGGVWQIAPVLWTAHPANPVLPPGPPGAWDEHIRERMWVIYDGGRFHGWYGGWKGKYDKKTPNLVHLGYAGRRTESAGPNTHRTPCSPTLGGRRVRGEIGRHVLPVRRRRDREQDRDPSAHLNGWGALDCPRRRAGEDCRKRLGGRVGGTPLVWKNLAHGACFTKGGRRATSG